MSLNLPDGKPAADWDSAPGAGTTLSEVPDAGSSGAPGALLAAARETGLLAARHARQADTTRRLDPEVVESLVDAGFAEWFVPRRWGGASGSFAELTEAVAAVGEGCASAAWIGSLLAYTARFVGYLPLEGQGEVWEKGPGARVISSLVSSNAVAQPVPGGWRLSGAWTYASGVEFSDWALVAAPVPVEDGKQDRFFAVPRSMYTIEETWFTVGMRATGSHSLLMTDVVVPEHRSFLLADMFAGRNAVSVESCHSMPLFAVNGLTFGAPVLGAARGALRQGGENLTETKGRRSAPGESHQIAYARSAGEIDAAGLLLNRIARTLDRPPVLPEQVVRGTRDASLATDLMVGAVERLFRGSGTRGQADADPLGRMWRDVHAAASHFVLQFEPAALAWTRGTLALA
jgi:two-component flavin-dependent monooxygenase/oxygenase LndZ5